MNHLRIVTRNSNLALVQCDEVAALLPQVVIDLVPVLSLGDKDKNTSLMGEAPADFFTRELDEALLNNEADIAVHSAKDLPYPLREGLMVVALLPAADQSDSLVGRQNLRLAELPLGATVGTSSKKRAGQLAALRPDLKIASIRGTIEERIAQVDNGHVDALIVATCALDRLGLRHRASEVLLFETHPLQGHLAVVAKKGNNEVEELFRGI
ncbi:MAG: hydroxymethylbilane synthase [Breznakibacter sp.]